MFKKLFQSDADTRLGFIIGTGRCGTTMLSQMLNSHSNIYIPNELQILFEYNGNGKRLYEVFSKHENRKYYAEDYIRLVKERCPSKIEDYFDYKSFFYRQKYPIKDLGTLVSNLYCEMARSKGKNFFLEQTPWYGQRLDIVHKLFPDAKYIHMVRDGRDVALSFTRSPWWHEDVYENLERWNSEILKILYDTQNNFHEDQFMNIRYEDVVFDPDFYLKKICVHLGVEFEQQILDAECRFDYRSYMKASNLGTPSVSYRKWSEENKNPVFQGSVYSWKEHDFSSIPNHIKQTLDMLGYES